MKIQLFFFVILFYIIVLSFNSPFEQLKSSLFLHSLNISILNGNDNNNDKNFSDTVGDFVEKVLMSLISDSVKSELNISSNCSDFMKALCGDNNTSNTILYDRRELVLKFLLDSSFTSNEIHYYDNCLKLAHFKNKLDVNYTYFIILAEKENTIADYKKSKYNLDYEDSFYINGFCLPKNEYCSVEDFVEIYKSLNDKYKFFDVLGKLNGYTVDNTEKEKYYRDGQIQSIIIISFMSVVILLIIFNYQIFLLLKKCFKKEKRSTNNSQNNEQNNITNSDNNNNDNNKKNNNENKKYYTPKWVLQFRNCLSFSENFNELFNFSSNSTEINKYSGLIEIRGVNAISILLTILGQTFVAIYNSPLKTFGVSQMQFLLKHQLYFCIFIGIRFSPRIIFSCSGYTLIYKYLCYIDKNNENFSVLKFIFYQSHKVIVTLFLIFFYQYSLNFIYLNFDHDNLPFWVFFQRFIMNNKKINIAGNNLDEIKHNFFYGLLGLDVTTHYRKIDHNIFDYYWIAVNEFVFFIFGICLITIGFKFQLRFDIFIIILFVLIVIVKIIFFYYFKLTATLYYYMFDYGLFMTKPLFNFPYFLIGLYFGLMNYTLQKVELNNFNTSIYTNIKGFSFSENEDEEKKGLFDDSECSLKKDKEEDEILFAENKENVNDENNKLKIKNDKEEDKEEKLINEDDYSLNNNDENGKPNDENTLKFLNIPIKFINCSKKIKNKIIALILINSILLFIPIISHYSVIICKSYNEKDYNKNQDLDVNRMEEYYNQKNLKDYISSRILEIIYLIDTEFIVFIIHWIFIILRANGENNILSFFKNIVWEILNKSYFSFSLICNMVILFSIYSTSTINSVNIYNIFLHYIFNTIFIFLFTSACYLLLELPLKKMIKYISNKNEKNDYKEEEEDEDEDNNEEDI